MAWLTAIGLAASAYGTKNAADKQSKAAKNADATNRQSALDTNELNKEQFERSNRRLFEAQDMFAPILQGYTNNYLHSGGSFGDQVAARKGILDKWGPSLTGARDAVGDIYSGANRTERLGQADEVGRARVNVTDADRGGIDQALARMLQEQGAADSRGGFRGGDSYTLGRTLGATTGAYQAAGGARARAELENAMMRQEIIDDDIRQRGAYASSVPGLAQSYVGLSDLPEQAVFNRVNTAMQPYNFFQGNPVYQNDRLPYVNADPSAGAGGQILSNLGSSLMSYSLNQRLANQYGQQPNAAPAGGRTAYGSDGTPFVSEWKPKSSFASMFGG